MRIADPDFPEAGGQQTRLGLVGLVHAGGATVWVTSLADGTPVAGARVSGGDVVTVTDDDGLARLPDCEAVTVRSGEDRLRLALPRVAAVGAVAWFTDAGPQISPGEERRIGGAVRGTSDPSSLVIPWSLEDEWGHQVATGAATPSPSGLVTATVRVPDDAAGRLRLRLEAGGMGALRTWDVGEPSGPSIALELTDGAAVARVQGADTVDWTATATGDDQPAPGWVGLYLPGEEGPFVETTTPVVDGVARLPLPEWSGPGTWRIHAEAGGCETTLTWARAPRVDPLPVPIDGACQSPLALATRPLGPGEIALVGRAPFVPAQALITVTGGDEPTHLRLPVEQTAFGLKITLPAVPTATVRVDLVGRAPRAGHESTRPAWASASLVVPGAVPRLAVRVAPIQPQPGTVALVAVDVADPSGRPVADAEVLLSVRDAVLPPEPLPRLQLPPLMEGAHSRAWIRPGHPEAPPVRLPDGAGGGTMGARTEPPPRDARTGALLTGRTDARGRAVLPWPVAEGAAAWDLRALALLPDGRLGSTAIRSH